MQTTTLHLQLNHVARRVAKRLCTAGAFALAAGRVAHAAHYFDQAGDVLRLTRDG